LLDRGPHQKPAIAKHLIDCLEQPAAQNRIVDGQIPVANLRILQRRL